MKAKFTDLSHGQDISKCTFELYKTAGDLYLLDSIYDGTVINKKTVKPIVSDWFYSYDEVLELEGFMVSNSRPYKKRYDTYKTSSAFLKRVEEERSNSIKKLIN